MELAGIGKWGIPENRFTYNAQSEKQKDLNGGKGYFYETDYRGYDPQLGRFVQYEPLADLFSGISPYQYAFNNPISFNDPLGLEGEEGDEQAGSAGSARTQGTGSPEKKSKKEERAERRAGRKKAQGSSGGSGGSGGGSDTPYGGTTYKGYVPVAGSGSGNNSGTQGNDDGGSGYSSSNGWQGLDKQTLLDYVRDNYCQNCSDGTLQNKTGNIFEDAFHQAARGTRPGYRRHPGSFPTNNPRRRVEPDGSGTGIFTVYEVGIRYFKRTKRIKKQNAVWFEVKASDGTIYNSTNNNQVVGHIQALARLNPETIAWPNFKAAKLVLVTTSDTGIAPSVESTAAIQGIAFEHYTAEFMMVGDLMLIRFITYKFSFIGNLIGVPTLKTVMTSSVFIRDVP